MLNNVKKEIHQLLQRACTHLRKELCVAIQLFYISFGTESIAESNPIDSKRKTSVVEILFINNTPVVTIFQ